MAEVSEGWLVEVGTVEDTLEPCNSEDLTGEEKPDTTETCGECSSTRTISNQFLVEDFSFSISSLQLKKASNSETEMCRICHQDDLYEPNLSLCNCRGSVGLIHKSCLERWLVASDSKMCELCGFGFTVKRQPKYNFFQAIGVWLSTEDCQMDRLHVMMDSIQILYALPLIVLINHQTSAILDIYHIDDTVIGPLSSFFLESPVESLADLQDLASYCVSYFLVGAVTALDMLSIGWIYMRWEAHYYQWRKWYRAQCTVNVVLPEQQGKAQSK